MVSSNATLHVKRDKSLPVAVEPVADHTAVVAAGHTAGVVAAGAAGHTVVAAVRIDRTATIRLAAVVVAVAAVAAVGSSQVGSSFVLGCSYFLYPLAHLQSFP